MRINKLVVASLIALGATGVCAGTTYAAPVPSESAVTRTDHGVTFSTTMSDKTDAVVTTIDTGAFAVTMGGEMVTVTTGNGLVIANLPTSFRLGGQKVSLHPSIEQSGKKLVLKPIDLPANAPAPAPKLNTRDKLIAELQKAAPGALIGGVIGMGIGLLLPLFGIFVGPIGALIGLFAAGGQPLIDAGVAYAASPAP